MADGTVTVSTLHGISIGSLITGAGVWTAVATLIGIILRSRVPMRKMEIAADEQLRVDLMARLDTVQAEYSSRVSGLEERLEHQRDYYESKLDQERIGHAADLAIVRHRMNNLDQCLTMILALIEANPERAQQAAARVREMRSKQELAEAAEKGAISGAKITAAASKGPGSIGEPE